MDDYKKRIGLKDGRELIVRRPNLEHDLDELVGFLSNLPDERKNYFRYNVADPKICRARLEQINWTEHWRLIAEIDGEIVGNGTLDRDPFGWTRHMAHLRSVVHPNYEKLGVGPILLRELVGLAQTAGIERLYAEVIKEQKSTIRMLEKEGFLAEITLAHYAKDLKGRLHDVVIMSNNLEEIWEHLAQEFNELDIRYSRFYSGL
jgi:ribosomal protein S18 acetylase RimI-like enzyme